MEQYEKSGTGIAVKKESDTKDLESRVRRLEDTNRQQQDIIVELQTEIRRLKSKLDKHADYLNRSKNNG